LRRVASLVSLGPFLNTTLHCRSSVTTMSAYASSTDSELETKKRRLSPKPQRPVRSCVTNPSREPLTEDSLFKLEQAQPQYRLAQRNLDHWFFYIESTIQDTFDTYLNRRDKRFYPSTSEPESVVSLSQADFQESHHSPASSADLFGFTVRSPPPDVQVIVSSRTVPSPPAPSPQLSTPAKTERPSSSEWEGLSPLPAQSPSPTLSPTPTPVLASSLSPPPAPTSVSPRFHLSRSSSRLPKKRSYVTLSDTDDS
jgi:hypothetical protein